MKSRCLTPRMEACFDRWTRLNGVLLCGFAIAAGLFVVVFVLPRSAGRLLLSMLTLAGAPAIFLALGVLRYAPFKILLGTYDILFFMAMLTFTLGCLMVALRDDRCVAVVLAYLAFVPNVFFDANVQGVRRVLFANAIAVVTIFAICLCITMEVTALDNFILIEYKSLQLRVKPMIIDGLATLFTMLTRNLYRGRNVLLKRTHGWTIECVSFRCRLRLCRSSSMSHGASPSRRPNASSHIQQMLYTPLTPEIRDDNTLANGVASMMATSSQLLVAALRALCALAFAMVVGAATADLSTAFGLLSSGDSLTAVFCLRIAGFSCTLLYVLICGASYQRDLLLLLITSFDFAFLSILTTVVHIILADCLVWASGCLTLGSTWLWMHWVFCFDALTPVARQRLGLNPHHVTFVFTVIMVSTLPLDYLLLERTESGELYDRVLFRGRVFGKITELRVLPSFTTYYITVLSWCLRIMWRQYTAVADELLIIDGPVVYTNYLRAANVKIPDQGNVRKRNRRAMRIFPKPSGPSESKLPGVTKYKSKFPKTQVNV